MLRRVPSACTAVTPASPLPGGGTGTWFAPVADAISGKVAAATKAAVSVR